MDRTVADPDVLDSTAAQVSRLAAQMRPIPQGLRAYLNAAAGGCGDAGLADAIHGFEQRCLGAVDDLGQVTEALSAALREVGAAFRAAGG
jgi:hypothetical protein